MLKENSPNESSRSQCKTPFFALQNPIKPFCEGTQNITVLSLFPPWGHYLKTCWIIERMERKMWLNEQRQTDGWRRSGWSVKEPEHQSHYRCHTWLKHSSIYVLHMHSHMHTAHIWLRWLKSKRKINKLHRICKIALLICIYFFLQSGHCLSVLQSFRLYIYKVFPPGRQLKWPWNQSDQTHQWGIKCCWLVFTAVNGKCLSNWNINDAGNENRTTFFMFLKQKQAIKITIISQVTVYASIV